MAAEEEPVDMEETENDQGSKAKKSAKHDSGAADLEKVTDYVEEAEISSNNLDDVSSFVSVKTRSPELPCDANQQNLRACEFGRW